MLAQLPSKVPKWPFFLGDAFLLGAAYFIYLQTRFPMGAWQLFFIVLCAAGGAMLCITPFLLEYRLLLKLAEAQTLTSVTTQFHNLEQIAGQIGAATGQWCAVQEQAGKTAAQAQQLSDRMTAEAKAFTEFLQRANDNERAMLRLELDKLKRAESEWVQVLVRIIDHINALHGGAVRSGQTRVIEQISNFQLACFDAARRIGLIPFVATPEETFNPQRHQLADVEAKPPPGALISDTIAAGYNLQGKLLRPALVRLQTNGATTNGGKSANSQPNSHQSQLPLGAATAS